MYQMSIRFDDELMKKLKEVAQEEDRSVAYIVNKVLKSQLLKGSK